MICESRCDRALIGQLKLQDAPADSLYVKLHGIDAAFVDLKAVLEGPVRLNVPHDSFLHPPVVR